jgi:tRNA(Ile)-lysidine synthase
MISDVKSILINDFHLKKNSKILIAVSGGVDSVVLLDILFQIAETEGYEISIAHYNHKIRETTSDSDELLVTSLAKKYKLKIYIDSSDVKSAAKKNNQSIELTARNLRYAFLDRISKSLDYHNIAMAHTADDSAETVMFNLLRGTGLTGLSGIPKVRNLSRKIQIIRPILNFRKSTLYDYAAKRNLKWNEDETNLLSIYSRNRIRNDLLKKIENEYNPQIIETLNRTAAIIKSADDFIREHIKPYIKNAKWNKDTSTLFLQIQLLKSTNIFLQGEIIQSHLENKFKISGVSHQIIERIIELIDLEVGSIVEIGKDILALRDRNQIVISRIRKSVSQSLEIQRTGDFRISNKILKLEEVSKKSIKLNDNPLVEYFDFDKIPILLYFRNWEPGDTFKPIGMTGKTKVSDFLINKKITLFEKRNILVLSSRSDIIWLCGQRINEDYKVTDTTTRYLKATFEDK